MGPCGVILAGGRATRMGGADKALLRLGGVALIDRVIARLAPQVAALAINANGDPVRFAATGLPVLPDSAADRPGPLAGVLAALDWAAGQGSRAVVTVAADTPFVPTDLVARLVAASAEDPMPPVLAATPRGAGVTRSLSGDLIRHPTCGLWPVALRDDLRAALAAGQRKAVLWADGHGARVAVFDTAAGVDPFFNVNTPADLRVAEAML